MLIDFHTHLFPDALAEKALERLAKVSGVRPETDGTVRGTLNKLEEWQVDRAVVMHIATSTKQQDNVNRFAAEIRGGKLVSFGSVHFENPETLDALTRLKQDGFPGIKLHPDYQGFDADDRRLWPVYERARDLGLMVCFHAGFDPLSPEHIHAAPAMLSKVLRDFPGLKMIAAHLGGMNYWDEVEEELCGKDLYLDTAFIAGRIDPQQCLRIISRHGAHRVLFGSDCPWQASNVAFRFLEELPLSATEKDLIYYQNAEELLGLSNA